MWNGSIIEWLLTMICWLVIIVVMIKIYRKQETKAKIWKVIVATFVGLISVSFTWTIFAEPVKIAVLPLGLWILFAILKHRRSWHTYRQFAWLGFWANYLFLTAFFIGLLLGSLFYSKKELSTYLADVKDAQLLAIHPSAQESVELHLPTNFDGVKAVPNKAYSIHIWYNESVFGEGPRVKEKFPYLLLGTQAKVGSGMQPTIFVEQNGKGLLVTNKGKQFYFSLEDSIIREVQRHD
ncbi:hypothetical protein [Metasolibacillus meyeri]|uniref:hypothetical protein n=1 Tax=Metasolibacillus meyeri TaxID=1071052 RepID=UPI000D313D0B|nr:hypothetical protein [Metasolibacillus meyeri]